MSLSLKNYFKWKKETKYLGYTLVIFLIATGFRYFFRKDYLVSLLFFAPIFEELMKLMLYKLVNYFSLYFTKKGLGKYNLAVIGIVGALFGFWEGLRSYPDTLLVKQTIRMISHIAFPLAGYTLSKYRKSLKNKHIYWISGAVLTHIVFNWINNFYIQTGYVIGLLIIIYTIISSK